MFGGPSRPDVPRGAFGLVVFILCLVGLLMVYLADGDSDGSGSNDQGETSGSPARSVTVEVDRVVDGDTAKVFYEGESEYVRYIGIDTPESVDPNSPVECFGEEAKARNEQLLEPGEVRLKFGPEKRDRFDRLLAYVYVTDVMLNEELLRGGYAETLTIPPNDADSGRFERIESEAREAGRGLWGSCT